MTKDKEISFSICIPNYNYAGYIGETIESVLNQTYPHFEIVIVDNASTDNSWDIIKQYEIKDARIKTFRNQYNVGFAPNLDRAAFKANNEFIIMLSSDDTMKPTALEIYANILSHKEIDINNILLTSATDIIDSNGNKTGTFNKNYFHNILSQNKYTHLINDDKITDYNGLALFNNLFPRFAVPGPFNATLYSKTLYDKVGGYGSINLIGPDGHFANKCLLEGAEVIFIDKALFNYRVHNAGQLNISTKNKNINILIDRYIFSNAYSDKQLASANLNREVFQKATLRVDCLNGAVWRLSEGEWLFAFRHLCFAFSAYPKLAFRTYKSLLVLFLLILGPLGILISKFLIKKYN